MAYYSLEKHRQLYDGYRRCFSVNGNTLLLIQESGKLYLIENRCPHMDWSLDTGKVNQGQITCPKHNIRFNLTTGTANGPGRLDPLKCFQIIHKNDSIGVEI